VHSVHDSGGTDSWLWLGQRRERHVRARHAIAEEGSAWPGEEGEEWLLMGERWMCMPGLGAAARGCCTMDEMEEETGCLGSGILAAWS